MAGTERSHREVSGRQRMFPKAAGARTFVGRRLAEEAEVALEVVRQLGQQLLFLLGRLLLDLGVAERCGSDELGLGHCPIPLLDVGAEQVEDAREGWEQNALDVVGRVEFETAACSGSKRAEARSASGLAWTTSGMRKRTPQRSSPRGVGRACTVALPARPW